MTITYGAPIRSYVRKSEENLQ
eukprot:UN11062